MNPPSDGWTPRTTAPAVGSSACVRRVTGEPGQHCFGYYDKCPWNGSGRSLLAMQAEFCDRQTRPDDTRVLFLHHWRPLLANAR